MEEIGRNKVTIKDLIKRLKEVQTVVSDDAEVKCVSEKEVEYKVIGVEAITAQEVVIDFKK